MMFTTVHDQPLNVEKEVSVAVATLSRMVADLEYTRKASGIQWSEERDGVIYGTVGGALVATITRLPDDPGHDYFSLATETDKTVFYHSNLDEARVAAVRIYASWNPEWEVRQVKLLKAISTAKSLRDDLMKF
jgi:hypothetical protein